ncbi:MAG: hypothetical protein QOF39_505 [Frankiales bacterium]|nr:hypothetical protein [Frankiales bacterium]
MRRAARSLLLPVAFALVVATGCASGTPAPTGSAAPGTVTSPAGGASPQDVVRAYLAALNAHDVATATRLLTAEHAHLVASEVDSWFTNVRSITAVEVGYSVPESGAGSGSLGAGYAHVVRVGATFNLHQKDASSMQNGRTDWGYLLVRNADTQPWLIADEGMP